MFRNALDLLAVLVLILEATSMPMAPDCGPEEDGHTCTTPCPEHNCAKPNVTTCCTVKCRSTCRCNPGFPTPGYGYCGGYDHCYYSTWY